MMNSYVLLSALCHHGDQSQSIFM